MKENEFKPELKHSVVRSEVPYYLPTDFKIESLRAHYQEQKYDHPFVTTIYFGGEKSGEAKPQLFDFDTLKLRLYSPTPQQSTFSVPLNLPCTFEIKSILNFGNPDRKTVKVRAGRSTESAHDELLLSGEVLYAIATGNFEYFLKKNYPSIFQELRRVIQQHAVDRIIPLAATTYKRSHFLKDSERVTVDENVTYYECIPVESDFIMVKRKNESQAIAEVKQENMALRSHFEEHIVDPTIVPLNSQQTKGVSLRRMLIEEPRLSYQEMELDLKSEEEWVVTEREVKLDSSIDLRPFLKDLQLPNSDIFLGSPTPNTTYHYYYLAGGNSISVMCRSLEEGSPRVIKYKRPIENRDGVLVREEIVSPFSYNRLSEVSHEIGINLAECPTTPVFSRNRVERKVYFIKSGNVFTIYADHCSVVGAMPQDALTQPLNQIEIEYEGTIVNPHANDLPFDGNTLDDEFKNLELVVRGLAQNAGIKLENNASTKYNWIQKQKYSK